MTENRRRLQGRSYAETRSAVLDLIRAAGTISRVELAQRSALGEATISKIVRELLSDGIVVEAGHGASTGGKRPVLLRLTRGGLHAVGVALDRTNLVAVLCTLDGSVVDRLDAAGAADQPPRVVVRRAARTIQTLLQRNDVDPSAVVGLGVAVSGRRTATGWGVEARLVDAWDTFDTGVELRALIGLDVLVENDAHCAALGTFWAGGQATDDSLTVYMSNGIGAGIVLGGRVYRGASGNAGEIGHIVADPNGIQCWCGSRGCLETVGTPHGLKARITGDTALSRHFLTGRQPQDVSSIDLFEEVATAAKTGDARAGELIERAAEHVATALLGLVNALDLGRIQLTGPGFAIAGGIYADALRRRVAESAVSRGVHPVRIELGGVGPDVAAIGAASAVLHSNLTPHHNLHP